jgi:hypothetical protein
MSPLLCSSYRSRLSEEDKLIRNKSVFENRKVVCILIRNIQSNLKYKTRRLIIFIYLVPAVYFSALKPVEAMGLPMPPALMVRV